MDIEEGAFYGCTGLISIVLSQSVSNICHRTFSKCSNLKEVRFESTCPPNVTNDIFNRCPQLQNIYVPKKSIDLYKESYKEFAFVDKIKGF